MQEQFIGNIKSREVFFYIIKKTVDEVLFNKVANNPKYVRLWEFMKKMFIVISHGQATVEHGFSENKMALETNMEEKTLIARRTIKDYIRYLGGI